MHVQTKRTLRKSLTVIGLVWMFALSLIIFDLWFIAAANGGTLTISTNSYNEQAIELVIWCITAPVITLAFYWTLTDTTQEATAE